MKTLVSIVMLVAACGARPPAPTATCGSTPASDPAEKRAWEFFAACIRPKLIEKADAGQQVLGGGAAYAKAILTTTEPPQLRADPPARGSVLRKRATEELTAWPDMVILGDATTLQDNVDYARVEIYLRTSGTPTDGGIGMTFFVAVEGVVLGYRVPGG